MNVRLNRRQLDACDVACYNAPGVASARPSGPAANRTGTYCRVTVDKIENARGNSKYSDAIDSREIALLQDARICIAKGGRQR